MKKMKTVMILATVLFASMTLTSCNSDDDSVPVESSPTLVGTWSLTAGSTEEFTNDVSVGTTDEPVDANNTIRFTFNADGTFSEFESDTFIVNGEEVTETSTDPGIYTTTDNSLFITYDGDTEIEEINFTLSNTQFITVFTETYTEGNDEKKFIYTDTYTRQ